MTNTLALVLAGGRGKRMDMLCDVRPKPALPFGGRYRVIDFSLSNCVHSGIEHVGVLTDYQRSFLARYLSRWHMINARYADFRVLEPRDGSYKGTADAVFQNLDYVESVGADLVVVLAGDHIYNMDYSDMVEFHKQAHADATVGVVRVPVEEAHRFGTVIMRDDGRITEFAEKSRERRSDLASMGIYVFDRAFLRDLLAADAADQDSVHDFGYSLLPRMVSESRVFGFMYNDYWQDIGTLEAYYQANMELTHERPSIALSGAAPLLTDGAGLPTPRIHRQAVVINSLIGPGCVIKGRIENSVLSPGVMVEEQAVVRNTLVMENTFIGFHSVIETSVLDESLDIGSFCYIGFGNGGPDQTGVTVVGKGAVIPPRTAIGRNCKIRPEVRPADFMSTVIPCGATVAQASNTTSG
jgi:glucose-1-phosphate adenylyltransferase